MVHVHLGRIKGKRCGRLDRDRCCRLACLQTSRQKRQKLHMVSRLASTRYQSRKAESKGTVYSLAADFYHVTVYFQRFARVLEPVSQL